jgi:predicted RNA-binding protein YlxR (DUF448 family)
MPKSGLYRIVKNKRGEIMPDEKHTADGRGAYLCKSEACINKCIKNKLLNKAFKANVDSGVYESVRNGVNGQN